MMQRLLVSETSRQYEVLFPACTLILQMTPEQERKWSCGCMERTGLKSLTLFLILAPFTSSEHLILLHTLSEPLIPCGKWGKDTVSELWDSQENEIRYSTRESQHRAHSTEGTLEVAVVMKALLLIRIDYILMKEAVLTLRCLLVKMEVQPSHLCVPYSISAVGKVYKLSDSTAVLSRFGHGQLFVTLWTVACQASLSLSFTVAYTLTH